MLRVASAPHVDSTAEPIVAWRTWTLAGSRDGAVVRLLPLAGDHRPWPVREPKRASCTRRRSHDVPALHCTCGVHATHDIASLRQSRAPAVLGSVALWGTVVEHEYGFRAEYAYPQRMRLVCPLCFWQRSSPTRCEVVAIRRAGSLTPLCDEHVELCRRYGYPVNAALPAREVERTLLDAYAVELLP